MAERLPAKHHKCSCMIKGPLVFMVRIPWSLSCQQTNTQWWRFHPWNNNFLLSSQRFWSCQCAVQFKTVSRGRSNHCSLCHHLDIQIRPELDLAGFTGWLVVFLTIGLFSIILKNISSGNYRTVNSLSWGELDLYLISYTSLNIFPVNYQMRSAPVQTFYMKT